MRVRFPSWIPNLCPVRLNGLGCLTFNQEDIGSNPIQDAKLVSFFKFKLLSSNWLGIWTFNPAIRVRTPLATPICMSTCNSTEAKRSNWMKIQVRVLYPTPNYALFVYMVRTVDFQSTKASSILA